MLTPRFLRWPEIPLVAGGFVLNLGWEFAQSPLYADWGREVSYLLWSRFHCTVGDVLILLGAYWVTALLFFDRRWPGRPGLAAPMAFVVAGLAYTVWSEWLNTSLRSAWQYRPEMPVVLGIGVSPILQWLVIPTILVTLLRRRYSRAAGEPGGAADRQPPEEASRES